MQSIAMIEATETSKDAENSYLRALLTEYQANLVELDASRSYFEQLVYTLIAEKQELLSQLAQRQ